MKKIIKPIFLIAVLAVGFSLINTGCKKKDSAIEYGDPVISNTGSATLVGFSIRSNIM